MTNVGHQHQVRFGTYSRCSNTCAGGCDLTDSDWQINVQTQKEFWGLVN
jgi:hypothetical protein